VFEPELVKLPLNVKSFEPPMKPLPPQMVAFETFRDPLAALNPIELVRVKEPDENALSLPIAKIVPAPMVAPATVVAPVYMFVPLTVIVEVPVTEKLAVMLLVLEITPLRTSAPPFPD
jgi:hypothetical protein